MALTYNQINAITHDKFMPKLADNIFDSNPLLYDMKKGEGYKKINGGNQIICPLEYAVMSAAGTYSGADVLSTTDNESFSGAVYQWKQYYANISINGLDELKNSGDAQVIDFVKSKVKNAEKTLASLLGDGLYSAGTDAKALAGLRVMASASNTVGGISQTDYSWWRPQLNTSATPVTLALLKTGLEAATVDNEKPSIITTTRTLSNAIWGLMQPQQRFTDSKRASAGFENILVNGVPVVADSHCPSSHLFMLNYNSLFLGVHSKRDMEFVPFQKPVNQDVKSAKVLWAGALCFNNLRLNAAFTALTA